MHDGCLTNTYNKPITIFQHSISYFAIAPKKSFNVFFSGMVRKPANIYSCSHDHCVFCKTKNKSTP